MHRKLGFRLLHGIETFEFDARISGAELPVDCSHPLIAMVLPALNLPTQFLDSGNVVGQTLPGQHAQFDLSDIEPTRVDGGCNGSLSDQPALWPVPVERPLRSEAGVWVLRLSITTTTFGTSG